jgi:ADP-heptose:LPS heptosyltransferase
MTGRVLAVRLDSAGDVLVTGPAVRAMADRHEVAMLVGPRGAAAAELLPGVAETLVWPCPWILADPPPADGADVADVVARIAALRCDAALVFTSFHQSPLPTALLLRMAGIAWVGAISVDYPGSLLDLRHPDPGDVPEAERALGLATAAGWSLPRGDDGGLRVTSAVPDARSLVGDGPYVVVHPGCSAPAREWSRDRWRTTVAELAAAGERVVVTGAGSERELVEYVAADSALALAGRTDLAQLAGVLAGADALLVGNTGPAHLAAAVRTPVVSLHAPTVPAARWRPYGVPHALLGDQSAACRDTRAVACPVPGHPCLDRVTPGEVRDALHRVRRARSRPDPYSPLEVLR